jgi:hypothetical protein
MHDTDNNKQQVAQWLCHSNDIHKDDKYSHSKLEKAWWLAW